MSRTRLWMIIGGMALAMMSLWVGSYACGKLHLSDWQAFPTFMTAMFGGIGGLFMAAYACIEMGEKQ